MSRIVLVVAAHPDDEVLGCGGTVARHAAAGDRVHVVIAGEGATARDVDAGSKDERAALAKAAQAAAATLGSEPPRMLGLPDNRLDTLPLLDIIKPIEAVVAEVNPDTVYTHHGGDLNIDHRIVHQAVLTACRPVPGSPVRRLYAFETLSSTEWGIGEPFRPGHFVAIVGQLDRKRAALKHYDREMRAFPHARSFEAVDALARLRGATVGLEAAEAFVVIRDVEV